MSCVGIVIVSHSPKVAEGAADMVRQMVGPEVPCACSGRSIAAASSPPPRRNRSLPGDPAAARGNIPGRPLVG